MAFSFMDGSEGCFSFSFLICFLKLCVLWVHVFYVNPLIFCFVAFKCGLFSDCQWPRLARSESITKYETLAGFCGC